MLRIKVKKIHRSGNRNDSSPQTIASKFITYKVKELILRKVSFLKGTGYFINEGFLKETPPIKKKGKK